MQLSTSDFIATIALILTVSGFIFNHFAIIAKLQERLASLETKMEIFWRAVGNHVSEMLKSYPTNIEKDILLEKLSSKEITIEEAFRLKTIIKGEMQSADKERLAYILLLAGIDVVIYEIKSNKRKPLWRRCLGY
jgi:hypothetical protein